MSMVDILNKALKLSGVARLFEWHCAYLHTHSMTTEGNKFILFISILYRTSIVFIMRQ